MNWQTAAEWTTRILGAVALAFMGLIAWQGQQVMSRLDDHEKRITAIESNSFSKQDGAALTMQIAAMRSDVAVLQRGDVDAGRRLERIEEKMDAMLERFQIRP